MGRGLSELQKRLLVYAKTGPPSLRRGTSWITVYRSEYQEKLKADIRPGTDGQWTLSEIAAVSRALRRLENRGLIVRVHKFNKRRLESILLTPEGDDLVKALYGELKEHEFTPARLQLMAVERAVIGA
jgi:hypothetical protein